MSVQRMESVTTLAAGSRVRYEFARYDAPGALGIQTRDVVVATVIEMTGETDADVVIEFPHWRTGKRTRRAVSPRRLTPLETQR